jgi:glycosyltransferase involved in cell wall biosynthesis
MPVCTRIRRNAEGQSVAGIQKKTNDEITACLVVYNEEAVIGRCLESLRGVVQKIVVVHDGPCRDRTLEICRNYGCEVHEQPHVGMCEGHRVFSFMRVKTSWILLIDADEFLSEGLRLAIPALINDTSVSAYDFYWPYWDGARKHTSTWPVKRALFRKDRVQYLAFPHAAIQAPGKTRLVPLTLEHRPGYDNYAKQTFRAKHKKWIHIHAQYFLKDWSKLPRFPAGKEDLKPNYARLRDWPLLLSPLVFIYHFAGLYLLGGWRAGWLGARNAFYQALYYLLLGVEVHRLKKSGILQR